MQSFAFEKPLRILPQSTLSFRRQMLLARWLKTTQYNTRNPIDLTFVAVPLFRKLQNEVTKQIEH